MQVWVWTERSQLTISHIPPYPYPYPYHFILTPALFSSTKAQILLPLLEFNNQNRSVKIKNISIFNGDVRGKKLFNLLVLLALKAFLCYFVSEPSLILYGELSFTSKLRG